MEVRTSLADLCRDDSEWHRGQQAIDRAQKTWRADTSAAPVLAALKRFGQGAPLDRCGALAELFDAASPRAINFASSLVATGIAALDAHPLGQLPLDHGSRDGVPALALAASGTATLGLVAYDGEVLAATPSPKTVRFQPAEIWMRVLVGEARTEHIVRRDRAEGSTVLQSRVLGLAAGETLYRYGPREALHMRRVEGVMVTLRLERALDDAPPATEHRLPDGALVNAARIGIGETRRELIAALLDQMALDRLAPTDAPADAGSRRAVSWHA